MRQVPQNAVMPMGRIIAIGDIHGCSVALHALLQAIGPQSDDLFIPLGDYVDRGPDSRGVIDLLLELAAQHEVRPILGNHEEMLLVARMDPFAVDFWLRCGGDATLASYGDISVDELPAEHISFFESCTLYQETARHIFVHANFYPDVPMDRQPPRVLCWEPLVGHKPKPHVSGKVVILGHTAQRNGLILDLGPVMCLDTYCYGGGWLSAFDVTTGEIWQANERGQVRGAKTNR